MKKFADSDGVTRAIKIDDLVPVVDLESSAAEILCFLNTWGQARRRLTGLASDDPKSCLRETSYLWNVLAALRGPDYSKIRDVALLKSRTTGVIRRAVRGLAGNHAAVNCRDAFWIDPVFSHTHFGRHVLEAKSALLTMFGAKALGKQ